MCLQYLWGIRSSDGPLEHADEAGTSEPRIRSVFADCTCVFGAQPALLRHIKTAHSQCAAPDDVVTRACEKNGWGQSLLCHTFAALNTDAGTRMAHGTVLVGVHQLDKRDLVVFPPRESLSTCCPSSKSWSLRPDSVALGKEHVVLRSAWRDGLGWTLKPRAERAKFIDWLQQHRQYKQLMPSYVPASCTSVMQVGNGACNRL